MGQIKILPSHVIDKIAAGEVVARPASVVKELVDNAIDAGAASISIDLSKGGKGRITVIDDGCGMDDLDVRLAVERHATSKISAAEDLHNITTLGFRGEALAAIAAVSRLTIETKVSDPQTVEGTRLSIEAGRFQGCEAAGCPSGTSVTVSDLFFNVPARRKFLRSDAVEYGHVMEIISSLALAHRHIRFTLSHDGAPKLKCHLTGDGKGRIEEVLGKEAAREIIAFSETAPGIRLRGYISRPGFSRATARDIFFFVNGRPVKDRTLQHALLSGYETFLARGEYPAAVLYVDMDPSLVDVNVHPAKSEVRFSEGRMLHDMLLAAVRKTLSGPVAKDPGPKHDGIVGQQSWAMDRGRQSQWSTVNDTTRAPMELPGNVSGHASQLRVIGQFGRAFIVCEDRENNLILIDQHAAHERLGFEVLKRQLAQGKIERQQLLLPEQIKLNPKELAVIAENLPLIDRAGFEVEPFGKAVLMVKAVPAILGQAPLVPLFEKLAAELADYDSSKVIEEGLDRIFKVTACHQQVRAGESLTAEEMQALVRDIERLSISCCPHGRPATIKIGRQELEKWFKRT